MRRLGLQSAEYGHYVGSMHLESRSAEGAAAKAFTFASPDAGATGMIVQSVVLICALIGAISLTIEIGYRMGIRHWERVPEKLRIVSPTLEASVFGLMGLLI